MAEITKVKIAKVWTTSDGQTFDNKDKAQRHQAEINFAPGSCPMSMTRRQFRSQIPSRLTRMDSAKWSGQ